MDKKSVIDRYAEEIRSGGNSYTSTKRPEMHPDSLFNEKVEEPSKKKVSISIISSVLLFILSALMVYSAFNVDKIMHDPVTSEDLEREFVADIGVPEDIEDVGIELKSEPQYVKEQSAALERVRAWERLTRRLIDKFFSEPIPSGHMRKLCITTGSKTNCRTLNASDQSQNSLH
jgi:hypothetical protein